MDIVMKLSLLREKRSWVVACVVFVIGLLILELFIRFFVYRRTENAIHDPDIIQTKAGTFYFQAVEGNGTTYYVANDEIETPNTNGLSVVVIGDSFTEGYQVNDNEKYVSVASNLLIERGIDAKLHNFGKSSQKLADDIWLFKYIYQQYKPQIAVFQISTNDLISENNSTNNKINFFEKQTDGSLQIQHQPIAKQSQNELFRFIIRNSSIVGYGEIRFDSIKRLYLDKYLTSQNTELASIDTINLINEQTILNKISILKNATAGVKLVIILAPPFPFIKKGMVILDNPQYDELVSFLRNIPDLVVIDPSTAFIDLVNNNHFPSGFDNSPIGIGHWNKNGNAIVGQLLADELQKIIK
jgi:lysophospholipase L1-like esterase